MTTSVPPTSDDAERCAVRQALDALLVEHDPATSPNAVFRGARFDAGLAWVHLPAGLGGLGVRADLNADVDGRLLAAGAARADPASFFMALAGPTIATHGSDEQRGRFLRSMFTGEVTWCQLFSEPEAGSDLAGVATRAVRDGDEWVVNGQKVWNTLAHVGDRGMLLARTDPSAPKHRGMSYFALDMHAPGVEVRPLRQITGEAEFNEVYLTDVRIPDSDRIGEVGDGWRVALTTLMNERTAIGTGEAGGSDVRGGVAGDAVALWRDLPPDQQTPVRRDRLVQLWCRGEVARLTNARATAAADAGVPGPAGSISKLQMAALNQDVFELCVDLQGAAGQVGFDYTLRRPEFVEVTGVTRGFGHAFLRVRANSIEGGTSEILRNILGEHVLGLPPEPRVDKQVAWSDVPRNVSRT